MQCSSDKQISHSVDAGAHRLEVSLILNCCHSELPSASADVILEVLKHPINWDLVLDVARRNGVVPLIGKVLLDLRTDLIPARIKRLLRSTLKRQAQVNLFLTNKLLELVELFESNGIMSVPFKGPLLALQAYKNPVLRQYCDLDILVRPDQFTRAVRLLSQRSYVPLNDLSWLRRSKFYIGRRKDVYFLDPKSGVSVELHRHLSGSHFGLAGNLNRLWERSDRMDIAGEQVATLPFDDLLIYLCLHGSRHGWERFAWICDVHELITSRVEIDWDLIIENSRKYGCERVVFLGLLLVRKYFGDRLPAEACKMIEHDAVLDEIVQDIDGRLFAPAPLNTELGERYRYHLRLKERSVDRFKLHVHYMLWYSRLLLTPTAVDRKIVDLPKFMYPIYFVTRPLRLAYTYILKGRRIGSGQLPI